MVNKHTYALTHTGIGKPRPLKFDIRASELSSIKEVLNIG